MTEQTGISLTKDKFEQAFDRQKIFDFFCDEHNLMLTETEINDIYRAVNDQLCEQNRVLINRISRLEDRIEELVVAKARWSI